jgi:hypothetical protein
MDGLTKEQLNALKKAYAQQRELRPGSRLPTTELLAVLREIQERAEAQPGNVLDKFAVQRRLQRAAMPNPLRSRQ